MPTNHKAASNSRFVRMGATDCGYQILQEHGNESMSALTIAREALRRGYSGQAKGEPDEVLFTTAKSFWAAMSRDNRFNQIRPLVFKLSDETDSRTPTRSSRAKPTPIHWTPKKVALVEALRKASAVSATSGLLLDEITSKSRGKSPASISPEFSLIEQGIVDSVTLEGEGKRRYFLTRKGLRYISVVLPAE